MDFTTLAIAATPSFLASAVEFVEATTIVLAVGVTRGWRAPLVGAALATITLAFLVLTLGATLVAVVPEHALKLFVGALLLLFGLRWLRKAILRFAGIVALHDEELIYQQEIAALRSEGSRPRAFDRVGALVAYKAVLLEGTEVAFIVIAFGAGGGSALTSRWARGSRREIFRLLQGVGQSVYGLLVDDGQLAIGAIVALAITWLIAAAGERLRAEAGWVLLALAVSVVVANVYVAGLRA